MSSYLPPIERIYLIGSLRHNGVRELANRIRKHGFTVFDDWHSAGTHADEIWQAYEKQRGHDYLIGIRNEHARNVYNFDLGNINKSDTGLLLMPAGKSAHLELGYMLGQGKRGYVLFEGEPERWDVMYQFATDLFMDESSLLDTLRKNRR
jgi:nucleoside 2-deoxyribosyltransferase